MSAAGQKSPPQITLDEMLRVMDVATELRKQRETVEKEFAVDETRQMLRERLLAATSITGERVSEVEVDTAIAQYFDTLYTYRDPPRSLNVTLAHLYVRRGQLSVSLVLVLALAGVSSYMLHTSAGMFSHAVRSSRQAVQQATSPTDQASRLQANAKARASELETTVREMSDRIRAIARDAAIPQEIDRWLGELDVAKQQLDEKSLTDLSQRTTTLLNQLNEDYEVRILSTPNEHSGVDRYSTDSEGRRIWVYYVIVEARDASGQVLTRTILDAVTRRVERVTRWAEKVPQEVFDRIKADKKADGLLDETLFAVKERGYQNEEIKLVGSDNRPLSRLGQITEW